MKVLLWPWTLPTWYVIFYERQREKGKERALWPSDRNDIRRPRAARIARIRASNSVCKKSRFPEAADEAEAWNVLSVGRSLTIDLARTWEVTVYVFSMVYNSFDCPFSRARACYTRRARIARNEGVCDRPPSKREARTSSRASQIEFISWRLIDV